MEKGETNGRTGPSEYTPRDTGDTTELAYLVHTSERLAQGEKE
jgi:hypothetical protein